MPDQSQSDPNQNSTAPPATSGNPPTDQPAAPPSFSPSSDLPPIPPAFQSVPPDNTSAPTASPASDQPADDSAGSAAPPDSPPIISTPKKKFGGGKIIATILGIFLLVGGIAGGVLLTQQNQNIAEKAGGRVRSFRDIGNPNQRQKAEDAYNDGKAGISVQQAIDIGTGKVEEEKFADFCSQYGDPAKRQSCRNGGGDQNFECPNGFIHCGILNGACRSYAGCVASGEAIKADGVDDGCAAGSDNTACPGLGNCAQNTGNCFVKNGIGVKEGSDEVCDAQGHWTTCETGYTCSGQDCIPGNDSAPADEQPPPPSSPTAQCQNIKAYSSTWVLLTPAQLSALTPATSVNFCIAGVASEGTFDKGKFTINSIAQAETTTKRPGSEDYCQTYTIPTGVTTFNVTAQIHHATLGWK